MLLRVNGQQNVPPPPADPRRLNRIDVLVVSILTIFGGIFRFVWLGTPNALVFDETYYAKDACYYVKGAAKICGVEAEQTMVHPPLGKWLLSIGVKIFGYDSFGWRVMAAVAGTVTIIVLYMLAKRLLRSTLGAAMAAGLLTFDLLHLVQSRISMLDIFVPLFALTALLLLVTAKDRAAVERSFILPLAGAGVALGAAVASKWAGVFFIPLALVLWLSWGIGASRKGRGSAGATILHAVLYLGLLPIAVYVFTYVGRVDGSLLALPWNEGSFLRSVWDQQLSMLEFHANLTALHGYQSPAWSWPLVKRPVSYHFDSGGGTYREIMALGSPIVWWTSLIALVYVGYAWIRRRGATEALIAGGFVFAYLPWLLQQTDRSATFLFYLLPAVPFMCLALGYVAVRLGSSIESRIAIGIFTTAAVASFMFFSPLVLGQPLSQPDWQKRILFEDCTKAEGYEGSPAGWCWI